MDWLLLAAAAFVAFANGANDNFKGFATVWGSQTLSYRKALVLATAATVAGSLASLFLAQALVQQFSGKGLVPDAVAAAPTFILSVAIGTAATVFAATRTGLPVSTTHALIGGLIGAGLGQAGGELRYAGLVDGFLLPLLVSPLAAAGLGMVASHLARIGIAQDACACVAAPPSLADATGAAALRLGVPAIVIGSQAQCAGLPAPVARFSLSRLADRSHTLSAAMICFARGVNDTPKLAALLAAAHAVDAASSVPMIAAIMAAGGIVYARRVAVTMSQRLTRVAPAQGLAANLSAAALVLLASKWDLPVSTTHVTVGAIAGAGAGGLHWPTLRNVGLSWVATLPLAALLAWLAAIALR
jgi:PiT family inorganic phosphate transporter